MHKSLGIAAILLGVVGFTSRTSLGAVTINCTPSNLTPDGNEVVEVECMLSTNSALTLNSYRVTYPCLATLGGGASGTVSHLAIPATACTFGGPDPACNFSGFQASCNGIVCFSSAQCDGGPCLQDPLNPGVRYCEDLGTCAAPSPYIDTTRPDYALLGVTGFSATASAGSCNSTPPFVGGNAPGGQGKVLTIGQQYYVGTFRYRVSACAVGSFTMNVVGAGNPPNAADSTRAVSSGGVAQLVTGNPAGVSIDTGVCCGTLSCLGNFNSYCCINNQGGLLSKLEASCTPPNPNNCICTADVQCNDYNPCTNDLCAPANPAADEVGCIHASNAPQGYCCDPTGVSPLDLIDDGNPCTIDYCEGGTYPAVHDTDLADGDPCTEDGNVCTLDICLNGQCLHDAIAANGSTCTSDGNSCTQDVCSNGTCIHSASGANGLPCPADGVFCTIDICSGGVCSHPNVNALPCEQLSDCPVQASSCTGTIGNPGLCVCTGPTGPCYGDVFPTPVGNFLIDLDDILCVLDGFVNFSLCPQGDIFPCTPNGLIDVDDVLAILDAFVGLAQCGIPCG